MEFLIDIVLEILYFAGTIYDDFNKNDNYKIKLNRKKVLRFLRKNWDKAFTSEQIKDKVLRKLNIEGVFAILDYLKVLGKVEVINEGSDRKELLWKYKDIDIRS